MNKELLENYVYYDNELGVLRWKKCRAKWIQPGTVVGSIRKDGYREAGIEGRSYLVHRLIFLLHKGYMPKLIDHIDRDPSNNRIENLRPSDKRSNAYNCGLPKNNKSGYRGVSWDKTNNKWAVRVKHNGKYKFLGYFADPLEAHNIRARFLEKEGLNV